MTESSIKKQGEAEILLESGTNELEVLIFSLGTGVYGVNVAKVREVILPVDITASPKQHQSVLGMFNQRGQLIPVVDLHDYFGYEPESDNSKDRRIIVMEFNGVLAAFQVDRVEQIYRMSWTDMRSVPDSGGGSHFCITGITEINDQLVLMLDFESIIDHISMTDEYQIDCVPNPHGIEREKYNILVAEDSNFIRSIIVRVLAQSGYCKLTQVTNGHTAWEVLNESFREGNQPIDIVITDIEMPLMDGLALTKNIKRNNRFSDVPVILFSSLITADTRHKGTQVGANEQISKPQLPYLVEIVDKWTDPNVGKSGKAAA